MGVMKRADETPHKYPHLVRASQLALEKRAKEIKKKPKK